MIEKTPEGELDKGKTAAEWTGCHTAFGVATDLGIICRNMGFPTVKTRHPGEDHIVTHAFFKCRLVIAGAVVAVFMHTDKPIQIVKPFAEQESS